MLVFNGTAMTQQFKMRLPEEQIASLDRAAKRFRRRSGQQVAEEIIGLFLEVWERAEQLKLNSIESIRESALKQLSTDPKPGMIRVPVQKIKGGQADTGQKKNKG